MSSPRFRGGDACTLEVCGTAPIDRKVRFFWGVDSGCRQTRKLEQLQLVRAGHCSRTRADFQFPVHVRDVTFDRWQADDEMVGYGLVLHPCCDKTKDFEFPGGSGSASPGIPAGTGFEEFGAPSPNSARSGRA